MVRQRQERVVDWHPMLRRPVAEQMIGLLVVSAHDRTPCSRVAAVWGAASLCALAVPSPSHIPLPCRAHQHGDT